MRNAARLVISQYIYIRNSWTVVLSALLVVDMNAVQLENVGSFILTSED